MTAASGGKASDGADRRELHGLQPSVTAPVATKKRAQWDENRPDLAHSAEGLLSATSRALLVAMNDVAAQGGRQQLLPK